MRFISGIFFVDKRMQCCSCLNKMRTMSRTRFAALALAAALPFSAVQVAAPLATSQTAVTLDSTEERAALASQAVEELINEYRVANGLHPLVTHELYDAGALSWSKQMVADIPTRRRPHDYEDPNDERSALRHSDIDAMGYSGENIGYHTGFADTEDDWKRAAETMFSIWRNSPDHNENMLRPDIQGMGLGLVRTDDGEVWGTTWFFIDDSPVKSSDGKAAKLSRDKVTKRAIESGKPFYTPAGAKQRLGVGDVENPTDTKGYKISYVVGIGGTDYTIIGSNGGVLLDKTISAKRGMDPVVTGKAATNADLPPVPTLPTPVDRPVPPEDKKPTGDKKPGGDQKPTGDKKPAEPTGKPGGDQKPTGDKKQAEPTGKPGGDQKPAGDQKPTGDKKPAEPTGRPVATTTATPAGDEGSSTTGIVIGVIVGLLAIVGAAVAALPMVAPDLARQLNLPGAR